MNGPRHLISLDDLPAGRMRALVSASADYAQGKARATRRPLAGSIVGIYFRKTSTRTRTSFSVAALRLGARIVAYGPDDLQTNTGETIGDTGRVLAGMLDGLVIRTAGDEAELYELAASGSMTVINAMSAQEHPTQAIADLSTILALRGGLEGVRIGYYGEGNNTASALALAVARVPEARLFLATPPGYGVDPKRLASAQATAEGHRARVEEVHEPVLPEDVDFIYTTRWQTTGTVKPPHGWRPVFEPFRVTREVLARHPDALFMHDLPAHRGEEVDGDVLDGPRSVAFLQAQHKLFAAMAVLNWSLGCGR